MDAQVVVSLASIAPLHPPAARIHIRSWTRRDRRALARWPAHTLPAHWLKSAHHPALPRASYAVILGDVLVGRVTIRDIADYAGRIGIYLHPEYYGQRIGSDCLEIMLPWLYRRLGFQTLRADVASDNIRARQLFERAGFELVSEVFRAGYFYLDFERCSR